MSEALEDLVDADTRLLRTARTLLREPGRVCRDYISGRRVPWMHPFKYALLMATAAFLVQRWLYELSPVPEDEALARLQEYQVNFGLIMNFMFLPFWASLTRLIFRKSGLSWIEHLVVALYGFGQLFLLQTCLMPLARLGEGVEVAVGVAGALLPVPYLAWLAVTTWGSRWRTALPLVFVAWFGSQVLLNLLLSGLLRS